MNEICLINFATSHNHLLSPENVLFKGQQETQQVDSS